MNWWKAVRGVPWRLVVTELGEAWAERRARKRREKAEREAAEQAARAARDAEDDGA